MTVRKFVRYIKEFIREYSTYNYWSGKRYRKKHKIGEYKEETNESNK